MTLFGNTRVYPGTPAVPVTNDGSISGIAAPTSTGTGSNSNDSWDLDDMMRTNPKMANLLGKHKKSADNNVLSFYGPLTIFDDQSSFDSVFPKPVEMYKIPTTITNKVCIFERDRDDEDLEAMQEKILFHVFLDEYKLQYVGEDTPELRQEILTSTTSTLVGIKSRFVNSRTKETVTLSPDDVYKRMTEYIVLLPDNAQSWMLSLSDTFFHALTQEMQADMLQHKFVMPLTSISL